MDAHAARRPTPFPTGRIGEDLLARLEEHAVGGGGAGRVEVPIPFTGGVLGAVPRAEPADVRAAVRRAREAQREWASRPARERARPFLRLHDAVLERRAEVLDLIQLETGKARLDAFEEVADVAVVSRHYAVHGPRLLRPRRRKGAIPGLTRVRELRRPAGVVGIIVPWNYPLALAVSDAVPALVAGNAVVLKPDPRVPFTALWAADSLRRVGLPPGLFQVAVGEGPVLGPPLIDEVDHLSFTGSAETGRAVAARAGERLVPCSLELGGKNPMLVLADADLERAAAAAVRGCFSSAGQLCISMERIYVERAAHEEFVERFVDRTRALRLGAGLEWDFDVGSLASAAQLGKVRRHVEDAVGKGARLRVGGRPRPDVGPWFYEPTVLEGVGPGMEVYAEETFGPVVSVYAVDDAEEGVRRANASRFGLNASVWTRDRARGRRLAARLRAGTVNVNDAYAAAWASVDAPMGGFGDSGWGRRHGREGIHAYTRTRTVAVQRLLSLVPPDRVGGERWARALTAVLRLLRRLPGLR